MSIIRVTFPKDRLDLFSISTDHAITVDDDGIITSFVFESFRDKKLYHALLVPKAYSIGSIGMNIEMALSAFGGAVGGLGTGSTIGLMRDAKRGRIGTLIGAILGGTVAAIADEFRQHKNMKKHQLAYYIIETQELLYDGSVNIDEVEEYDE